MPSENNEKRINSVKVFVEEISKLRSDSPAINAEQWFFRGQKFYSWDVRPNIFRGDFLASEHIVIERALRQNPIEFRYCADKFEILTKLQHYGLGTRLLDLTLNPLVALYFAAEPSSEFVKNRNGQYTQMEHDGIVYYKFKNECALQDIQVRIAMAIPFIEFGKSMSLEHFCKDLKADRIITESEYTRLVSDNYTELIRLLQTNSFLISTNSNIRLIQQRGAFLIAPSINIKTTSEIKSSMLSKAKMNLAKEFDGSFIIPSGKKGEIREELDFFNVNEATLFPELEHQMNYIQCQLKFPVGTVEEYFQYIRKSENIGSKKFEDVKLDVATLVKTSLPNIEDEIISEIIEVISIETKVIDWRLKDSVISSTRRSITKLLMEVYSANDAKSRASEIMNKLLVY